LLIAEVNPPVPATTWRSLCISSDKTYRSKEQYEEIQRAFLSLEKLREALWQKETMGQEIWSAWFSWNPADFRFWCDPMVIKSLNTTLERLAKQCWKEIQRQRAGKPNLMDVIRSESQGD